MKNLDTLFEKNPKNNFSVRIHNGAIHYINHTEEFNGSTLNTIINFVNSLRTRYKTQKVPVFFEFPCKKLIIQDKLAYVMFECICYSLKKEKRKVYVYWKPVNEIITEGVFSSPLKLLNTHEKEINEKFITKFENELYKSHFRKLISFGEKENLKSNYLGLFQQEMEMFLGTFDLSEERIDKISEVIAELVGNAGEHGDSDCLVDVDITNDHTKVVRNVEQQGQYYGINIAIVGFSDKLLGDAIKRKIKSNKFEEGRYQYLADAYLNHAGMIEKRNGEYDEEYFWNIAALQDKISGRQDKSTTGGTGMTVLINGLQKEADNDSCYMLSGSKVVFFKKEFIEFDSNKWLGFNEENDFLNCEPDESILGCSDVYIPGTAYNLNFVMRKEENK